MFKKILCAIMLIILPFSAIAAAESGKVRPRI